MIDLSKVLNGPVGVDEESFKEIIAPNSPFQSAGKSAIMFTADFEDEDEDIEDDDLEEEDEDLLDEDELEEEGYEEDFDFDEEEEEEEEEDLGKYN